MIAMGIDPDTKACAFAVVEALQNAAILRQCFVVRETKGTGRERAVNMAGSAALRAATNGEMSPTYDILVVEGQDVRYTGRASFANPQDICNLAMITGACLASVNSPFVKVTSPMPHDWKGSVPKSIKQQRILKRIGIEYTMTSGKDAYPVPVNADKYTVGKVNQADWKDLIDAIGLAVWGLEQEGHLKKEQKHVAF